MGSLNLEEREVLDQSDYYGLTLNSLGSLTEKSDKLEFSVTEISDNMGIGRSKNRILYSLFDLIFHELVKCSDEYFNNDEEVKDISYLMNAIDSNYYLTGDGLDKYDENIKIRKKQEKIKSEELSPDIEIMIYIYKKMIGFLFSYPRILDDKLDSDQKDALRSLVSRGFIEQVRSGCRFKITESGKKYLEGEAKLRNFELEEYVSARTSFSSFLLS